MLTTDETVVILSSNHDSANPQKTALGFSNVATLNDILYINQAGDLVIDGDRLYIYFIHLSLNIYPSNIQNITVIKTVPF